MKYLAAISLVLWFGVVELSAQTPADSAWRARRDSLRTADSVKRVQKSLDSLQRAVKVQEQRAADSIRKVETTRRKLRLAGFQYVLRQNPFFDPNAPPVNLAIERRKAESSDGYFYFIVAMVLYIALMRLFFYKYMSTMFTLFFRATLRQQQLREQLLQAPLPALLMNIFFVVSTAAYCTLVAYHYNLHFTESFWTTLLYAALLIAGIYIMKFIFLNLVGWIFGITGVTDTYIFIVFLINKMIGIFLLPFIALLAFPTSVLLPAVLTISYILVAGMLFYRFIISYRPVRSEIKLTRIHFFLYLCAFEIAPLLLIYKVLLGFAGRSI